MGIPGEHDKSSPLVRLDDLPHECLEFKYRVRDVEDRQKPSVALVVERKVFHHAGDFGIAMLRLVLFPANLSRERTRCYFGRGKRVDLPRNFSWMYDHFISIQEGGYAYKKSPSVSGDAGLASSKRGAPTPGRLRRP